MKFDYRLFFQLLLCSWRDFNAAGQKNFLLSSFRTWLTVLGRLAAIFFFHLLHSVGFLLDEILFPRYRAVEIQAPIFIIGPPRSGSTFFFRLLAQDEETFSTIKAWEMLLAPAVCQKKFFLAVARLDHWIGGPVARWLDNWAYRGEKLHRVTIFDPEEDELLLSWIFRSFFLFISYPWVEKLARLAFFDAKASPAEKRIIMAFYKNCVKRHLYVFGQGKRYLAKNPYFSAKVEALQQTFPDARIIFLARNPLQVVPSYLSLLSFRWQRWYSVSPLADLGTRDFLLDAIGYWYRHPLRFLAQQKKTGIHLQLGYNDLMKDPEATAKQVFKAFGLPLTRAFRACLQQKSKQARNYRSNHQYSFQELHVNRQELLDRYADIFADFGFDRSD